MSTGPEHELASDALDEKRPEIFSQMMEKLSSDHIYQMHFGNDWDIFVQEDIRLHLDNLILAVRFNLKDSPANHFHYMQSMLLNRGRCTMLIREAIAALGESIHVLIPEHLEEIQPFLESASSGIAYSDPGSKSLTEMQPTITQEAAENLARRFPQVAGGHYWLDERTRELSLFVSYLADGLEIKSPKFFASFVEWVAVYHKESAIEPAVLDQELNSLSKEITRHLEPISARRLRPIISKVRRIT